MVYKRKHNHHGKTITYAIGDATYPEAEGEGPRVITHVVNDIGKWGSGFVLSINKRWLKPREEYFKWASGYLPSAPPFELGQVQFVQVEPELWVANMIAQHQTIRENASPIRYESLRKCLKTVAEFCIEERAEMVGPRFGSGLARGSWEVIADIVKDEVLSQDIEVTIYDLE